MQPKSRPLLTPSSIGRSGRLLDESRVERPFVETHRVKVSVRNQHSDLIRQVAPETFFRDRTRAATAGPKRGQHWPPILAKDLNT